MNTETNKYEHCFSNCQTCNKLGNTVNHKCQTCKSEFELIKNLDNHFNCETPCSNFYYYNSEKEYVCLTNNECPNGYKLIYSTHRCIDNCLDNNVNNYYYEYNKVCYHECIEDTYELGTSHLCELDCKINNKYFNYERSACEISPPQGYYCNDTNLNTINHCHERCKTCEEGGTDENNNCQTCPETGPMYFYLGNCKYDSECTNDVIELKNVNV